jgi:hypothetical protein
MLCLVLARPEAESLGRLTKVQCAGDTKRTPYSTVLQELEHRQSRRYPHVKWISAYMEWHHWMRRFAFPDNEHGHAKDANDKRRNYFSCVPL